MEQKYIKDFVIALAVILVISFGIKDSYLYRKVEQVPRESKYKKIALSEQLLNQIKDIEHSIQDRKEFIFTVRKDTLEQNLIVRTRKDLEKQWKEKAESIIRLESTIIPARGKKLAAISYQGKTRLYEVGDYFTLGKIIDIKEGKIEYSNKGNHSEMIIQKLPPKPVEIEEVKQYLADRELPYFFLVMKGALE